MSFKGRGVDDFSFHFHRQSAIGADIGVPFGQNGVAGGGTRLRCIGWIKEGLLALIAVFPEVKAKIDRAIAGQVDASAGAAIGQDREIDIFSQDHSALSGPGCHRRSGQQQVTGDIGVMFRFPGGWVHV